MPGRCSPVGCSSCPSAARRPQRTAGSSILNASATFVLPVCFKSSWLKVCPGGQLVMRRGSLEALLTHSGTLAVALAGWGEGLEAHPATKIRAEDPVSIDLHMAGYSVGRRPDCTPRKRARRLEGYRDSPCPILGSRPSGRCYVKPPSQTCGEGGLTGTIAGFQ